MPDCAAPATVYQLRVVVHGISPLIWRRLLVPDQATIAGLHAIVQTAFGWSGEHLHSFTVHGAQYGICCDGGPAFCDDAYCSRPFKMSMKVTFRVAMCRHGEPRRAGCRAGFRWPGCRGGGQSVAVSSAMAVRAEDSSAMVLPAV